jgi:acyl transferase domain-containing protein/acyl carrier protein
VHTAAALDDGVVEQLTPERLATVLDPKAGAAWHLHELTEGMDLAAFVLYSSLSSVLGAPGLGNYAAANAFQDALAEYRTARGLPATSLVWGRWADDNGMTAAVSDQITHRMNTSGLLPISSARGTAMFDAAVTSGHAVVVPVLLDEPALRAHDLVPPLLRGLVRGVTRRSAATGTPVASGFARQLAETAADDRPRVVVDLIRAQLSAVLGHAPDSVDPRREFRELGLDSLTAVELRNRLSTATGLRLPATMVFDHPTPEVLGEHLVAELLDRPAVQAAGGTVRAHDPDDPIVIVGMSCRFPGEVASPEDLWRLVAGGVDAIGAAPADRGWPDSGRLRGGFVRDAAEFDPGFFGISPREALAMDPQQRLLLEAAWEAFEHAGIDPSALRGTRTGTFVGAAGLGYALPADAGGHAVTGSSMSVASGRIAYLLGLEGPAVTLDTACSSSLVALHLACQSLRAGDSSLAVAGGVTVMAHPQLIHGFDQQGALASDGRAKAFSDTADGMNLAEGVGLLVVERLSDARRHGHPVLAVVKGSAMNQDGASNGLTAPNGPAQQRVVRDALASAGLSTSDVDVVEAHGTGTTLGDPIEAQALLATYGQDRERPLLLGSVKSNIGHTQHAAGVASVIKMVKSLEHGVLPKTLHVTEPTSQVDWTAGAVELLTEPAAWPQAGRPRRAGVSSFGISGTNVHTIIEQAPVEPAAERELPDGPVAWVLSARSATALRGQAARLMSHVDDRHPVDVGHSLAGTRTRFERRAVVVGTGRDDLTAGLAVVRDGGQAPAVVEGVADVEGRTVFVFPGQGAQWAGMGVRLLAESPVFAERLAECAAALAPHVGWSVLDVLREGRELDRVDVVQPVSFAVMVALADLWRAHGVAPDAVVGHSQGEIAAAVVSGALSLEDGARVVALRSKAIATTLAGRGAMASIALPAAEVEPLLDERVAVAAVNGPGVVVVSGEPDAVAGLCARLSADGVRARQIPVDYASHSSQVELVRDELLTALAGLTPTPARVPFFSTVTGQWEDGTGLDAEYWYRNLRLPVAFEPAIRALLGERHRVFVEASPHPVLAMGIQETIEDADVPAVVAGTLRRDHGDLTRFLVSAAEIFVRGADVGWAFPGGRPVELPTYAFEHGHFWPEAAEPAPSETDPVDAEFWAAVEQDDVTGLASALHVDGESLRALLPALSDWRRGRRERSTVESWQYRFDWQALPAGASARLPGTWLVAVPAALAGEEWVETAVRALGPDTMRLEVAETGRDALAARLAGLVADVPPLTGVVSLLALDDADSGKTTGVPVGLSMTMVLLQALGDAEVDAPLWCVTRGAVSVDAHDPVHSPAQGGVWGFGRVAAMEHPQRWGGLVDLPPVLGDQVTDRLATVLRDGGDQVEDQVAVRPAGVFGRRLVRLDGASGHELRVSGTVLVTGGTGALGGHVARFLAGAGAEHLVLASRRGPAAPGADRLADELSATGVRVSVLACDVADRDALTALLDGIPEDVPLTGVVHTAGVLDDGMIDGLTPERFAEVYRAKVTAARHLDELTRDLDLSMFVLYGSAAGALGNPGQANYAAANAELDAIAHRRRASGLPATSVAWGLWAGSGLADGTLAGERSARGGVTAMEPSLAIAALANVVAGGESAPMVQGVDWARFAPGFLGLRRSPVLNEIPGVRQALRELAAPAETGDSMRQRLTAMSAPERATTVVKLVRDTAATVLGHASGDAVEAGRAFAELGFDSLNAVEFANRIAAATGLKVRQALVFDYPTLAALADHLLSQLFDGDGDGEELVPVTITTTRMTETAADVDLLDASDDEVFDFISERFGIS